MCIVWPKLSGLHSVSFSFIEILLRILSFKMACAKYLYAGHRGEFVGEKGCQFIAHEMSELRNGANAL